MPENKEHIPRHRLLVLKNRLPVPKNRLLVPENRLLVLKNRLLVLKNRLLVLKNRLLVPENKQPAPGRFQKLSPEATKKSAPRLSFVKKTRGAETVFYVRPGGLSLGRPGAVILQRFGIEAFDKGLG
jgi:hypothetical protein